MAIIPVTLRWKGHSLAQPGDQYEIQSDVATPNDYLLLATRPATAPYTPVFTNLVGDIPAYTKTLTMADSSAFVNNDHICIDREAFNINGKSGAAFNNVFGGQYITIPQDHKNGAFIYRMHEVYPIASVDFGTRHVVRYRIIAIISGDRLVAAEAVIALPTPPLTNDKCTMWGILDRWDGTPRGGVNVRMNIEPRGFAPGLGETLDPDPRTAVSDISGYFQLTAHKDAAKNGAVCTLTIDTITYPIKRIPDVDSINYLECI